jgi:hypothetical protein
MVVALALLVGVIASAALGRSADEGVDENFNVGDMIAHPERVTGAWEARLASGSTLGLSIALIATVDGTATTLRGAKQRIRFIRIIAYLRRGEQTRRTWWHTEVPGNFDWKYHRLRLHETSVPEDTSTLDLDMLFDPIKSQWEGTFKNAEFSGHIILSRPGATEPKAPVGTWKSAPYGEAQSSCIHVAQGDDGRLIIWEDVTTLDGLMHYVNGLHAPAFSDEIYAELLEDPQERRIGDRWQFRLGNQLGGEDILGELNDDGETFSGEARHYGNGVEAPGNPAYPFTWHRMDGMSCTAPLSSP